MANKVSMVVTAGGQPRRITPDDLLDGFKIDGQKIEGMAAGAAADDAVNKGQMDAAIAATLGALIVKKSLNIGFADFAALGAADFVSTNMGAVIPANGRLVGYDVLVTTPFDDGDADVDVKVEIGIDGETVSMIMGTFDVDKTAAGADGAAAPGAKGHPMCDIGGKQITVTTVTTNGAHLAGLDAGAMTVNLFYLVQA